MKQNLKEITSQFQLEGRFLDAVPYGSGHINDTFVSRFQVGDDLVRYIHQRLNHSIFKEPEAVMENIERVTRYAYEQIAAAGGDPRRGTMNLIPAVDGKSYYRCDEGNYWRSFIFIEGAHTYDQVENLRHIYSANKAFGNFLKMMSALPGERLHETIPDFHHTRKRFEAFVEALEIDVMNRAQSVKADIDFVLAREPETSVIVDMLAAGKLPERVTHNDTKLNNVLIDDITGEGICVIDLDTVMPGSALYDFGDSIRIGAGTAAEDERDLCKVGVSLEMFDYLAHGYLDAARSFLTPTEIDYLPFSAKLITLECGMRFLTDYLNGDTYFKTQRVRHNLDRCRTQFKMVAEMEQNPLQMSAIVAKYR
ncbi:MAG: aminoglycoside phosphotransferase family protein [Armatimonadetes bacterium]|nr:aminoglycoside phosphotransferase family protein [Armatimonadota bacterium]